MPQRKKLIEVALPLEAINLESAREKSIRHGHPSTLHLWWSRKPTATCRAVLWASLVDDPSSWADKFPTEEEQAKERQRLFDILGRIVIETDKKGNKQQVVRGLVSWDDINDPNSGVLEAAQREIARCLAWERGEEPPTEPEAVRRYIAQYAPPVYDPFAGGGSIPLEAQRLGLEAHASDLNPVAVLINKALIEIPPKFKDQPPGNPIDCPHSPTPSPTGQCCPHPPAPSPTGQCCPHPPAPSPTGRGGVLGLNRWYGAQGLAADVRFYGAWMRDEAFKRIGHLYPKVALTPQPPLPQGDVTLTPQPPLPQGDVTLTPQPPLPQGDVTLTPQPPLPQGDVTLTPQPPLPQGDVTLTPQPPLPQGDVTLTPQPPLPQGDVTLTPQPPLPQGEGELEKWEVPPAIQKKMQEVARQLRRESTPSEAILWEALRNRKLEGRKFRRQHPIGTFVVDFFCKEEALIVEVDGSIHEHQKDLDRQRQELLESLGLRFVRLSSHLVETNLPVALDRIRAAFRSLPSSPSGRGDGGEGCPSGRGQGEEKATVIAWLWARTVKCPNPACGCQMPLANKFSLSTKKGKEAWVELAIERTDAPLSMGERIPHSPTPSLQGTEHPSPPYPLSQKERGGENSEPSPSGRGQGEGPTIRFVVKSGQGKAPEGTVGRKGAKCIACGTAVKLDYVRQEGRAGRMGAQLMAIVAEGQNGRIYLSPTEEHEAIAKSAQPTWKLEADLPHNPRDFKTPNYGMNTFADLFTPRQLVALTTFSDLVGEAREKAIKDAIAAGLPDDDVPLAEGGTGARAYGEAISVYLGFAINKSSDYWSSICTWHTSGEKMSHVFTRQAIPMAWDFAEANPMSDSTGNFNGAIDWVVKVLENALPNSLAQVTQHDATAPHPDDTTPKLISTDPPYFDNIGYADLSDFFYVWLRRSLSSIYPNIFNTLLVPKTQELVATPYRFGGDKQKAKEFFETGLGKAFNRLHHLSRADYPLTVYYAFKQSEEDLSPPDPLSHEERDGSPHPPAPSPQGRGGDNSEPSPSGRGQGEGRASTGWETMLEGLIKSGFTIDGTWPMRSELKNRMVASGTNALASSIVLVCRPRPADAPKASRSQFLKELKQELPQALKLLQQGSIAPVDLAQASIGPGMAVYSRYAAVLENDGSPLTVRTALQLINQYLDEYLTEQEGEFDSITRWALTWFEQYQFEAGLYGEAETLSKAKNVSVQSMVEAGILEAKAGKVRLLKREEMGEKREERKEKKDKPSLLTSPSSLLAPPDWLITQTLIHALLTTGEMGAAELLANLNDRGAIARDLAYRLYSLCDKKGWTQEAIGYNSLVISWSEISRLALEMNQRNVQTALF